jgi:hypothetical protein
MDRFPETRITEQVFFSSIQDLETYTNSFYGYSQTNPSATIAPYLSSSYWDVGTDNTIYTDNHEIYRLMTDDISEKNAGSWSSHWTRIRNVNFMIARAHQARGDQAEINHFIGVARFFRAHLYYTLVRRYSDVPWYSRDLSTTDTELLFKPQDPRSLVVDSIIADLQFASDHIRAGNSRTRVTKHTALAMQSRIALYEGTFRKYHPELGLNDGNRFLEIAANAAQQVIESNVFSLHPNYQALFNSLSLAANREVIMYEAYDVALRRHNAHSVFDWTTGLSRDLMEDYLAIVDGKAVPFHTLPGYNTRTLLEIFKDNRDSRMFQTIMNPGYIVPGRSEPYILNISHGGYPQIKFYPTTQDQLAWGMSYTDLPIIRYAEILLNYAEARAELGRFTDEDMNMTISLLRDRAGVPRSTLAEWMTNIDPVQSNRYPNVTSTQRGAILEIRRERRVELAAEGFRFGDLMRWRAGKLLERAPEGSYIRQLGLQDLTGDGNPNIAIVRTQADFNAIPSEDRAGVTAIILEAAGTTIELTGEDSGYIVLKSQVNRWTFVEPKYYYWPIDERDMLVSPNLVQNRYWK